MADPLDIPKLEAVARAADAAWPTSLSTEYNTYRKWQEFKAAFTPAVAIALCERVRELEDELKDYIGEDEVDDRRQEGMGRDE